MKYPKEYLDEIKTRLKVSTVVSKTVSLKKRGKEFVGLSPFKNEKTPSFTVNDEKEFYHCFATSEHGNIFDFVMKTQNLKFGEAVKHLAQLAGMQPYLFSKKDEEREKKWNEYDILTSFLPKQMSDEDTKKLCAELIAKLGASSVKDMGKIMGELKISHSDEVDFSKAGSIIRELLNS